MTKPPTQDDHLDIRSLLGLDKPRVARFWIGSSWCGVDWPRSCCWWPFSSWFGTAHAPAELCCRTGEPRRSDGRHHGDRVCAADEPGGGVERIVRHHPQRFRGL